MANVLTSFLVGIGLDTKDFEKGVRNVDRGMGGLKSTILQGGAALTGALGLKALTVDFAASTDKLYQFSNALGLSANDVRGLGSAFEVAGGSADNAFAVLQKIQDAKDALAVKGEAGFLTDAAYSGINPQAILSGKDAYESLLNVLKDFDKLSPEKQRTLAQTLGVGPAEIALFKKGQGALLQQIELMKKLRPATKDAEESARLFRSEWELFGVRAGGIADKISVPLVGAMGKAAKSVNEFIDANRSVIDGTIARGMKFITENIEASIAAMAILGTGAAYAGLKITLATLGAIARTLLGITSTAIPAAAATAGTSALATAGAVAGPSLMSRVLSSSPVMAVSNMANFSSKEEDEEVLNGKKKWKKLKEKYTQDYIDSARKMYQPSYQFGEGYANENEEWLKKYDDYVKSRSLPIDHPDRLNKRETSRTASSGSAGAYAQWGITGAAGSGVDAPQKAQAGKQSGAKNQTIHVSLNLNDRVLEEKIIQVNSRTMEATVEDMTKTTSR